MWFWFVGLRLTDCFLINVYTCGDHGCHGNRFTVWKSCIAGFLSASPLPHVAPAAPAVCICSGPLRLDSPAHAALLMGTDARAGSSITAR